MAYEFICWSCGKATEKLDKVFRDDTCSHCHLAMKSCRNCKFYDPYAHDECREPMAEQVRDKERANYCDYFVPGAQDTGQANAAEIAKAKLDALFKK